MVEWLQFKKEYETELKYTKKQVDEMLTAQAKMMTVNRVVKSFTGRYGPTETIAMQILAIHQTPEGILVIVK